MANTPHPRLSLVIGGLWASAGSGSNSSNTCSASAIPAKRPVLSCGTCQNLDQIMNQCSISPVYYSRVYHLKAYVQLMLGNDELSQSFLEKGFYSSDIYGNRLERCWLEISKEWWFTGKKPMEDFWLKAVPDFPVWNVNITAQEMGAFHKNMYLLKVPELDISNPFPESSVEE